MADDAQDLVVETFWEPKNILLNKERFCVELAPRLQMAFSRDEYGRIEASDEDVHSAQPTAIDHLQNLVLVSFDKTIWVQFLWSGPPIELPERIISPAQGILPAAGARVPETTCIFDHGALIISGRSEPVAVRLIRIDATAPEDRSRIEVARAARKVAEKADASKNDGPADAAKAVRGDVVAEDVLGIDFGQIMVDIESQGLEAMASGEKTAAWLFKDEGATYRIRVPAGDFTLKKTKGLEYLYWFARHPKQTVSVATVLGEVSGLMPKTVVVDPPGQESELPGGAKGPHVDDVTTRDSISRLRERLREIAAERTKAVKEDNTDFDAQLNTEAQRIGEQLEKDTGLGGRLRKWPTAESRNVVSVRKAINRAYHDALKNSAPNHEARSQFVDHFKAFLKLENNCCYRPDPEALWRWD